MTDFHSLYEGHAVAVRRFALFLCGDPALADDITSETFMRAWMASGEIREPTVRAYLFTIARNLYRDMLRRNVRQTEISEEIPDLRPRVDCRVEQGSELSLVLAALRELPELDRAALLMRAQEEMSYQEIADSLGLSLGAVKTKIHRARLKLMRVRMQGRAPEGAKP